MTAGLELLRTGRPRGYLWIKAVTGVALTHHCADALTGRYVPVSREADAQHVTLPPAARGVRAWYLCGVTAPFRYASNDHLLLLPDPGAVHLVDTPGYELVLTGVRAQSFGVDSIPRGAPLSQLTGYATCRCWQAAWWLHRNLFRHTPQHTPTSRPATPKAAP